MMDLEAEHATFDLQTVTRLQQMKTGALIAFCLEAGAIMGRVPPEGRAHIRGYARDIGLAFQIADDLLDAEGDATLAGKALNKDAAAGKATFLSLLGVARARAQANAWMDWQLSVLGPAITPCFVGMVRTPPEKRDYAAIEDSKKKTTEAVGILDGELAKRAFVAGDAFSYGDIPSAVMANRYRQLVPERPAFKNFERWFAAIAARPAFRNQVAAVPLV